MPDPTIAPASALDAALLQLVDRLDALRTALAANRLAFVRTSSPRLEATNREHSALAEEVHALEKTVATRRAELCAALAQPASTRMSSLLTKLPGATARRLAATAARLRKALHALRVESAVGQRLLDVSRQAQEGLVQSLTASGRNSAHRYDRHARSVNSGRVGNFMHGTV